MIIKWVEVGMVSLPEMVFPVPCRLVLGILLILIGNTIQNWIEKTLYIEPSLLKPISEEADDIYFYDP